MIAPATGHPPIPEENSMSLVWREQLSLGNDVLDSDHRYLIDIINRIERSLEARDGKELLAALDSLSRYSQEHFAREEKIAHLIGYSQFDKLSLSHEILFRELDQARRNIGEITQEWSPAAIARFNAFLKNWLIGHVIKEDLLMKPVLKKHPSSLGSSSV